MKIVIDTESDDLNLLASAFMGMPIPKGFAPDGAISFNMERGNSWPSGTNLFSHEQFKGILRHILERHPQPQDANPPVEFSVVGGHVAGLGLTSGNHIFCGLDLPALQCTLGKDLLSIRIDKELASSFLPGTPVKLTVSTNL